MKLIINDLKEEELFQLLDKHENLMILSENVPIHHCIGCFGCWIKTPAYCVIQDPYACMGPQIASCNEIILISKCTYGG